MVNNAPPKGKMSSVGKKLKKLSKMGIWAKMIAWLAEFCTETVISL